MRHLFPERFYRDIFEAWGKVRYVLFFYNGRRQKILRGFEFGLIKVPANPLESLPISAIE